MPTLPHADHPNRTQWLASIIDAADTSDGLIIVGHSLGVTSALDYIEQSKTKIKGLVSVSGFADDYGLELNSYFLQEKTVDFAKVRANLGHAFVFYGDNDPYVTQDALQSLAKNLHTEPVVIKNGGHLNATAGFSEFPQLLDAIVSVG